MVSYSRFLDTEEARVLIQAEPTWSLPRISCTRRSLRSFSPSLGTASDRGSKRVPIRISVAMRGAPLACTAAWQSWIACETADHDPSTNCRPLLSITLGYGRRDHTHPDWFHSHYNTSTTRQKYMGMLRTYCICSCVSDASRPTRERTTQSQKTHLVLQIRFFENTGTLSYVFGNL
jgi:hypothetical protein